MLFGKDKGFKKIQKTIGKIQGMIGTLDEGVTMLQGEQTKNNDKIAKLESRNTAISTEIDTASAFRANLQKLITGDAIAEGEVAETAS